MGVVSAITGLIGAGVSAAGQVEAGQAQAEAYAYQAQVARNNAAIAQSNAKLDIQAGETAATNQGLKTRAAVGTARANQGASGIDPNTGSATAVQSGIGELGYLDAMTLRSNAAKAAYSEQVKATSETAQAGVEAQQAPEAAAIGATGTLLSGVSTAGSNFAKMQNSSSVASMFLGPFAS